jgi:glycerophosphoryl diester phosphodiesterase
MRNFIFIILLLVFTNCSKKENNPIVDVYGHGGISLHRDKAIFPSNSFESIQYAIDVLDADGVEIDVQMTKDSVLVLYHDEKVEFFSNIEGCISDYDYDEIKHLTLDRTKFNIVRLDTVLEFVQSRNKLVYLDAKIYNYCTNSFIKLTSFKYALNQSMQNINDNSKANIILGMKQNSFLMNIDYPTKCIETSNVKEGILNVKANNYKAILFFDNNLNQETIDMLLTSNIKWGVIGVKDKWSIDSAIKLNPNFVITDNIAYTKRITN